MKPYLICHMIASVDGRTLLRRWRPVDESRGQLFERLHERLGSDAWLVGRVTGGQGQLMNEIGPWMTGVNPNLQGKQKPRIMRYSGGQPAYREHCDAVAADGYRKLALV